MKQSVRPFTNAFTLLELSIVLIVIGLIVGGILVGKDLIRIAQLNSIMAQKNAIQTAMKTFKLKYNCIPGDCNKATQFGLGTNGNGNEAVEGVYDGSLEGHYMWQHLGNAGLINGSYTGAGIGGYAEDTDVEVNVPGSKIPHVGFYYHRVDAGRLTYANLPSQLHILLVGNDSPPVPTYLTFGGFITVNELVAIDQKYDDGTANSGNIRKWQGAAPFNTANCTLGTGPTLAYNTASGSSLCDMLFLFEP